MRKSYWNVQKVKILSDLYIAFKYLSMYSFLSFHAANNQSRDRELALQARNYICIRMYTYQTIEFAINKRYH